MKTLPSAAAALLVLVLGSGCAADAALPSGALSELKALIGSAPCDSDAQCRTLPVGSKACGGPQAYVAWSSKTADGSRLAAAADAAGNQQRAENLREERVSNCALVIDPGAACLPAASGRACQLRSRGRAPER